MSKKAKPPILAPSKATKIVPASESDLNRENIARLRMEASQAVGAPMLTDFALTEENWQRYAKQLGAYRTVVADIFYHRPDHPALLQEYIWTELDLAPRYPVLNKFLDFWRRELDGRLHSVQIGTTDVFKEPSIRSGVVMTLN